MLHPFADDESAAQLRLWRWIADAFRRQYDRGELVAVGRGEPANPNKLLGFDVLPPFAWAVAEHQVTDTFSLAPVEDVVCVGQSPSRQEARACSTASSRSTT